MRPGATVNDLLALSNAVLAGRQTGGPSASDIAAALDAINRGVDFGKHRVLIGCPQ